MGNPGYNLYVAAILYFKKGTDGPNDYGEDPVRMKGIER